MNKEKLSMRYSPSGPQAGQGAFPVAIKAADLAARLLSLVHRDDYEPLHSGQIADVLGLSSVDEPVLLDLLEQLEQAGMLLISPKGKIRPSKDVGGCAVATVRTSSKGHGIGTLVLDATQSVFVPPEEITRFAIMSGDTVALQLIRRGERDGKPRFVGAVSRILARGTGRVVGTVVPVGEGLGLRPDGEHAGQLILLPDASSSGVKAGEKAVVELVEYPLPGRQGSGVVVERLGESGLPRVEIDAIVRMYDLPREWPEAVLEQVRKEVARFDPEAERRNRVDLSDDLIVTIDPDDAKDYDDAISVRRNEDGSVTLGVHIADVSFFVPPGTALDEEARRRGNSVYFPGFVIPMLPEQLSNGLCSLQQDQVRLCKTVWITYDRDARPSGAKFANTAIRSARRLRYTEAQDLIDGKAEAGFARGAEIVSLLREMDQLARRIQSRRLQDGMLTLELPEVQLVQDDTGRVVDARPGDGAFTHTIIEMFMVEANEAASRALDAAGFAFLKRVHPEPSEIKQEDLLHLLMLLGRPQRKVLSRHDVQKLLADVRGRSESFALNIAVLRSMMQAEYSNADLGHYALASQSYAHFTSPIRRYPDLHIHRLLGLVIEEQDGGRRAAKVGGPGAVPADAEAMDGGGEGPARRRRRKVVPPSPTGERALDRRTAFSELAALGMHCSATERRAEAAERELRSVLVLQLMQGRIGQEAKAVVSGVGQGGAWLQLMDLLVDGFLPFESLPGSDWRVPRRGGMGVETRSGRSVRIGDVLPVRIARVDMARREMVLELAGGEQDLPSRRLPEGADAPRGGGRGGPPRGGRGKSGGARSGAGSEEPSTGGSGKRRRRPARKSRRA